MDARSLSLSGGSILLCALEHPDHFELVAAEHALEQLARGTFDVLV